MFIGRPAPVLLLALCVRVGHVLKRLGLQSRLGRSLLRYPHEAPWEHTRPRPLQTVLTDVKLRKHRCQYHEEAEEQEGGPGEGLRGRLAADAADSSSRTGLGASVVILQVVTGAALEAAAVCVITIRTVRSAVHTAARRTGVKDKAVIACRAGTGARTRTGRARAWTGVTV